MRRRVPQRMVGAPQEAHRPELLPVAGCAWGTHYFGILLVETCKDLFKFYSNVLCECPSGGFYLSPHVFFTLRLRTLS